MHAKIFWAFLEKSIRRWSSSHHMINKVTTAKNSCEYTGKCWTTSKIQRKTFYCYTILWWMYTHTHTHVHLLLFLVSCGADLNKTLTLKWNIHERAAEIEGSCNTGQASILEWVGIPFSGGSSRPFGFPTLQANSLQSEPPGKPLSYARSSQKSSYFSQALTS